VNKSVSGAGYPRINELHHPAYQDVGRRLGLNLSTLRLDDKRPDPGRWFRDHGWQVTAINRIQAAARYGRTAHLT